MRHRQHIAPTVRDWALTYWAIIDGTKKLSRSPVPFLIVAGVIGAVAIWSLILLLWKAALIGIIAASIFKFWTRRRDLNRPVPWDDDYRPEQDDDIPY